MIKKIIILTISILILIFMLTANSLAITAKGGNSIYVSKDEVIEGDLFVGAGTITIDGVVTGDLFFGGSTIIINGEVKGDIIGGGNSFILNGIAGDDVRIWCASVTINGKINKSLTAMGSNITLTSNAIVERDALIAGGTITINGKILGETKINAQTIEIAGKISKPTIRAEQIILYESAVIHKNLKYSATKFEKKEGAVIEGKVEKLPYKKRKSKWVSWKFYTFKFLFMIGAIIVGILLIKLFPKLSTVTTEQIRQYWKSLGIGFVVLICLPVASVLIAITVIGIPVSLILFLFYFLFLYTGKIFVSLVIGEEILRKRGELSLWALVLGMAIFTVLYNVPYIGWIIKLITIILGLGALSIAIFKSIRQTV